jgi:hypothetical protein
MNMRKRGEIADEIAGPKYSHNAALKRIAELEACGGRCYGDKR